MTQEDPVWLEAAHGHYVVKAEWDVCISVHNSEEEARIIRDELNKAYWKGYEANTYR